jgi:hypothetical protein
MNARRHRHPRHLPTFRQLHTHACRVETYLDNKSGVAMSGDEARMSAQCHLVFVGSGLRPCRRAFARRGARMLSNDWRRFCCRSGRAEARLQARRPAPHKTK